VGAAVFVKTRGVIAVFIDNTPDGEPARRENLSNETIVQPERFITILLTIRPTGR